MKKLFERVRNRLRRARRSDTPPLVALAIALAAFWALLYLVGWPFLVGVAWLVGVLMWLGWFAFADLKK